MLRPAPDQSRKIWPCSCPLAKGRARDNKRPGGPAGRRSDRQGRPAPANPYSSHRGSCRAEGCCGSCAAPPSQCGFRARPRRRIRHHRSFPLSCRGRRHRQRYASEPALALPQQRSATATDRMMISPRARAGFGPAICESTCSSSPNRLHGRSQPSALRSPAILQPLSHTRHDPRSTRDSRASC